ncbi:unnamed protein product [Periconia digitata]|uniref:Aldehyde dehydrogenase domain-containing protein n=1 Tax=Periconia digitata TaxID=1303443 RepID=A0A9W4XFP2_9PLEO|nr:unnamed protein product [Periconia digitata]
MSSPDATIEALLGTARAARCHNSFFRQQQLKSLHDKLRNNVQKIRNAVKGDTGAIDAEITKEIAATLKVIKEHYAGIDPEKELDEEYKVQQRQNAADRKLPWGVVYIEPQLRHTPFFSVVVPLCVALAAGNCVALKLETTTQVLPALLQTLLRDALESDTFQIVTSSPSSESIAQCLSVLQHGEGTPQPTYSQLVSPGSKVIAVVDRTADLSVAAEQLVKARFAFGGTSPYAPDVILVNEFVEREFLNLVTEHSKQYLFATVFSEEYDDQIQSDYTYAGPHMVDTMVAIEKDKIWNMSGCAHGWNGHIGILSTSSKTLAPLPPKISAPIFASFPITSLDHAVDLAALDSDDQLLAAYHFAAPAHTKYLSQFIKARISFANYVPTSLLVGPAAPVGHSVDQTTRYTKDQFIRHSPVFVAGSKSHSGLDSTASKEVDKLLADAAMEIKAKKRAEWKSLGFFEQGILIGLGVYGVPILTCLGASVYFGVRAGMRRWSLS